MKKSEKLITSSKIDDILEDITRLVAATLNIDAVSIMTLDDTKKRLHLRSAFGKTIPEKLLGDMLKGEEVSNWITRMGEGMSFGDKKPAKKRTSARVNNG